MRGKHHGNRRGVCVCVCVGVSRTLHSRKTGTRSQDLRGMGVAGGFFPPEGGVYGDSGPWEDGAWCVAILPTWGGVWPSPEARLHY